ncbi:MAG: hypothetical protein M1834_005368 [Cirrosporium novae-zelandiae]|nr:MAG: hypothetical protein M1834_005368 [Cirrosporium novae-zelandiae]
MANSMTIEIWALYTIGLLIFFLRFVARLKIVGLRGWQWDDIFAIIALVMSTLQTVMISLVDKYGSSVGIPDDVRLTLSPARIQRFATGSKYANTAFFAYIFLIYSLKGCAIFLYMRITLGLTQQRIVRWNGILCIVAFIACILAFVLPCRPFSKRFQVTPNPGIECTSAIEAYYTITTTNVFTDLVLVCIPLPLLWRVKLDLRKKIMVGIILCSGIFVVVAAILRCYFSIVSIAELSNAVRWALRESFVAITAVNAPAIRPLFSPQRWLSSSGQYSNQRRSNAYELSGSTQVKHESWLPNKSRVRPNVIPLQSHASEEQIVMSGRVDDRASTISSDTNGERIDMGGNTRASHTVKTSEELASRGEAEVPSSRGWGAGV